MDDAEKNAKTRRATVMQTISAVAWSFFGVRKGRDHEADMAKLNPVVVILTGVVLAACFVIGLILLVRTVVASAAAG
jgi:hypothetical protein